LGGGVFGACLCFPNGSLECLKSVVRAVPVAQLDRASASEAEGYRFDSCRGYS